MKICFFCDSIFSFGGVQRVLAVIAKELAKKHSVTILTMDKPSSQDMSMYELHGSNIHFEYFNLPFLPLYRIFSNKVYSFCYKEFLPHNRFFTNLYSRSSFPKTYRKLFLEKLNDRNYDIVIGVHAFISLRLAILRESLDAQKVVGWMHNSYNAFFNNPGRFLWGLDKQFQFEMPKLDKVIVLSKSDQREYQKRMRLGTEVINNPLTLLPQGRANKNSKIFLAVGRLMHAKGFDLLIDAFADFSAFNSEWKLNIVGDGPEKDNLLCRIKEKNLGQRIKIYPFTKNIQEFYSQASVFVLSSRWEGWGLVITEAMAHGLPIIAADLPVVQEILHDCDNSLLFRSEDSMDLSSKMRAILSMNLDAMGEISIEAVKEYSVEHILTYWENLLTEH